MPLATRYKIALASLAARMVIGTRMLAGRNAHVTVSRRGIRWELDLREGIDFAIYLLGAFELSSQRTYRRIIRSGDVVFDIGANIGAHTLPLADACGPNGCVHAFEATEFAMDKLRRNLDSNPGLSCRVRAHHVLLTDGSETITTNKIYSSWPLSGKGGTRHPQHKGRLKEVGTDVRMSLDFYADQNGLDRLDFVKLDVDGHEWPILQGMVRLLKNFHPVLLFELAPDYEGVRAEEILKFLQDLGYQFSPAKPSRFEPANTDSLVGSIPRGGSINILAMAGEKSHND